MIKHTRLKAIKALLGSVLLLTAQATNWATPIRAYAPECVEDPTIPEGTCITLNEPVTNPSPDLTPITTTPANANAPVPTPAEEMVYLLNVLRKEKSIPPVKMHQNLMATAQAFADRMAKGNFFSHNDPDNSCNRPWDRMKTSGYIGYRTAAENIAAGYDNAEAGLKAFENSPPHLGTMVNANLREVGIGFTMDATDTNDVRLITTCPSYENKSGPYMYYWVQDYGSRWDGSTPVLPIIINDEAFSTTSRQVNLYVYGSEYNAPQWASKMSFSTDGTTWTTPEAWAAIKTFTLPGGTGFKTVYAQLINATGTTTQTVSDTIYLQESVTTVPMPFHSYLPSVIR